MNYYSYINANVGVIHKSWIDTLKDLRGVTNPTARALHIEHLKDLYTQATAFSKEQSLSPQHVGALAHILDRPLEHHLLALKNTQPKNLL